MSVRDRSTDDLLQLIQVEGVGSAGMEVEVEVGVDPRTEEITEEATGRGSETVSLRE